MLIEFIPEDQLKPTFEAFENEFNDPQTKALWESHQDIFTQSNLNEIMEIVAEKPNITIQELIALLESNSEK